MDGNCVVSDAARVGLDVRNVAMLTGQDGKMTLTGLFVVRKDDPAKSIEDLRGYRILFGPEDSLEKRSAALASLEAFDVPVPQEIAECEIPRKSRTRGSTILMSLSRK